MIIFKLLITITLLAAGIYFDIRKRRNALACLFFYVSFLTMFANVFEDLTNWHELAVIATCLLIFAGILLIVRKIKNKYKR